MSIEKLQAENARLKTEVQHLMIFCNSTLIPSKELQEEIARLKAEVERLRASSFVTAVPVEHYERLVKAGDAMAEELANFAMTWPLRDAWNAAKEGKQP